MTVPFEDGRAVQPLTIMPCGARGLRLPMAVSVAAFLGGSSSDNAITPIRGGEGAAFLPLMAASPPIGSIIGGRLAHHA